MTTTVSSPTIEPPKLFEVYFYTAPAGGSIAERLFAKANNDYHKMYGYTGLVVHLSVRLGAYMYELSSDDGVHKYPWTPELLDNYRLIGFYTYDLSGVTVDKRLAALFTLENMLGKKLDIKGCLNYLWQSIGFGKSDDYLQKVGLNSVQNLNQPPSTFTKVGRKETFHLPFTCATLVNAVLYHLFEFEPGFAGHLAQSAALSLTIFAECGYGSIYDLDTNEWVIHNG